MDGPAIISGNDEEWWLKDKQLTKEEWWETLPKNVKLKMLFPNET